MTPCPYRKYIAERIRNGSQRTDVIDLWLRLIEEDGAEITAMRNGYCDACGTSGMVLIGDVEHPCRECKPLPDVMDLAKARREG